jgi:DNA (cytosine-5)-methyltransferase 1
MTHGSLFSGIGGFDLAAEWMGWDNLFHCEWNEFGQKVLKHYWPNAVSYGDITKTDFTIWRARVDVLTGGFPCQPYSTAGKRLGKEDERHLWPQMRRAIREIAPRYVVGENVRGLLSWNGGMVFDEVQADLEACGYEVLPFVLPACAVNAPHRRDRVWFIAHATGNVGGTRRPKSTGQLRPSWITNGSDITLENPNSSGRIHGQSEQEGAEDGELRNAGSGDTNGVCGKAGVASNASDEQLQRGIISRGVRGEGKVEGQGRQFSRPVCSQWKQFPTQSPICTGDDGIPAGLDGITFSKWRNESIKAAGNAIVPQVALQIFKAIQQTHDNQL